MDKIPFDIDVLENLLTNNQISFIVSLDGLNNPHKKGTDVTVSVVCVDPQIPREFVKKIGKDLAVRTDESLGEWIDAQQGKVWSQGLNFKMVYDSDEE